MSTSFKASIRKINDNAVTVSTPRSVFGLLNFGARMTLFNFNGNIVIYSPIKYDETIFNQAVNKLFDSQDEPVYEIKYAIAANDEHNLYSHEYKEKLGCKVIAGENCKLKNNCQTDFKLTSKIANRVIKGDLWSEDLNITDPFMKNLELVYLGNHMVHDVEVFDKTSKTLFVGDVLVNLGVPGTTEGKVTLEQYSPEVGYPQGYNPHGWLSYFTRYLQPDSAVCRYFANYSAGTKTETGKEGIKLIDGWNFEKIVMIHGNVIDKDAKDVWKKLFPSCFE
ncbi:hypothetical protein SBY92_002678 [Candida maltosa Xu316]|uniref:Metallo-beta-lactamase domain-containing protein n=1 Tax=Candida maltosa (strain Xu316) TaxID=1245528 RepID=M3HGW9_CANMX|nr:hypothetical protein G210_3231 [Candida maltosa Xu316]